MWFGFFLYFLLFLPHAASISCMSRIPRNNKKKQFLSILLYSFHSLAYSLPAGALLWSLSLSLSLTLPVFLPLSHCDFAAALINSMPRNGRVSNELLMNCFLACALFMLLPDWKIVIYTHICIYIFVFWYTHMCVCTSVCACVPSLWQRMFDPQSCRPKKPLQLAISLSLPPSLFPYFWLCNMCIAYSMNWNRALETRGCIRPRWVSSKWNIMKAGHNYQK